MATAPPTSAPPIATPPITEPPVAARPSAVLQPPEVAQSPATATPPHNPTLPKIFVGRPAAIAVSKAAAPRSGEVDRIKSPPSSDVASTSQPAPQAKSALELRRVPEQAGEVPGVDADVSVSKAEPRPSITPVPTVVDKSSLGGPSAPPSRSIASGATEVRQPRIADQAQRSSASTRCACAAPRHGNDAISCYCREHPRTRKDRGTARAERPSHGCVPKPCPTMEPPPLPVVAPAVGPSASDVAPHGGPRPFAADERRCASKRHGASAPASDWPNEAQFFAARTEFVQSLRLLSQALDVQHGTSRHSQALAAGMRALDEAEDFVPRGSRLEADLDLSMLISGHRTPVLKEANAKELSPLVAQQRYYSYAQKSNWASPRRASRPARWPCTGWARSTV